MSGTRALERGQLCALFLGGAAGFLGLWPEPDPVATLAWLALLAPAAGAACGALGIGPWPFAPALPGSWLVALVLADAGSARDLATPLWAGAALLGLFAAGLAVGLLSRMRPLTLAGLVLFLGCGLAGLGLGFGLSGNGTGLARSRPALARLCLDISPLVLVFDCAGFDWLHAQPDVYAASGVEWFPRRPRAGELAGPAVLVVGCSAAWLARARGRTRAR
jgi:hypothetical protein